MNWNRNPLAVNQEPLKSPHFEKFPSLLQAVRLSLPVCQSSFYNLQLAPLGKTCGKTRCPANQPLAAITKYSYGDSTGPSERSSKASVLAGRWNIRQDFFCLHGGCKQRAHCAAFQSLVSCCPYMDFYGGNRIVQASAKF